MRHRLLTATLVGIGLAALAAPSAMAGGWGYGCGRCGSYYPSGQVYYAAPTYSYAAPTVTVVPRYIIQPHYIVRRTYVIQQTRVIDESPAPCLFACGPRRIVNQGQYREEAYVPPPVYPRRYYKREVVGYRYGCKPYRRYHRRVHVAGCR